jgi:hypothetical protein
METTDTLHEALQALDIPRTADTLARAQSLERALRQLLANGTAPVTLTGWLDTLHLQPQGAAWHALERALSRATVHYGPYPVEGGLGFCPATLILSATSRDLPPFTPELFVNTQPEALVQVLEAHGLADDFAVEVDPQLHPASQIGTLPRGRLPELARHLTDAALMHQPCTLGEHPLLVEDAEAAIGRCVSIAGGRILASFLIPVIYSGESMAVPPQGLTEVLSGDARLAFVREASRALTQGLNPPAPLHIDAFVGIPRLVFTALFDAMAYHCEFAAYWSAHAALAQGHRQGRITFDHAPAGRGVAIGFEPGVAVDAQACALADSQAEIDRYVLAFTRGAKAAGLTSLDHCLTPGLSLATAKSPHDHPVAH